MALDFTEQGNGFPIILLHGFPMHKAIWSSFAAKLSNHFKVYTVDLPGFGKSALLPSTTIDLVGTTLNNWVEEQRLEKAILVGHSLGGYVALSMAHLQPSWFTGLVLFHSTALPDTEEKKESRNKVLDFVNTHDVVTFTSNFIQPLFANPDDPGVNAVRKITIQSSKEAVLAYTRAMRDRPDRTNVIQNTSGPILFIGGQKDPGISVASLESQVALASQGSLVILPEVGHMGMIENEVQTLEILNSFARAAGNRL